MESGRRTGMRLERRKEAKVDVCALLVRAIGAKVRAIEAASDVFTTRRCPYPQRRRMEERWVVTDAG